MITFERGDLVEFTLQLAQGHSMPALAGAILVVRGRVTDLVGTKATVQNVKTGIKHMVSPGALTKVMPGR